MSYCVPSDVAFTATIAKLNKDLQGDKERYPTCHRDKKRDMACRLIVVRRNMSKSPEPQEMIAISSIEDGLDFAYHLISSAIASEAENHPEKACSLLSELTTYIELRYVGETLLALEYLSSLGRACPAQTSKSSQFWRQVKWIAKEMQLTEVELEKLELPNG